MSCLLPPLLWITCQLAGKYCYINGSIHNSPELDMDLAMNLRSLVTHVAISMSTRARVAYALLSSTPWWSTNLAVSPDLSSY
ncbi:hypothetical protein F5Y00DRAFT_235220 [Daldinia vernicosa]|uniref:uncharacterized protein n=1 Tax=Daldinia vernicosa TaxID=114800 RepID=UPI0020083552|nr:uncharacterized protein F5Y00DRAFT_235220 [Daldinia vernicosa]KAI0849606.1 hypothetical protein F5Y00DRAFT_235220 [Daldinia vernicosa]